MSELLAGQLIVNTRPLHQQQGLTELLSREGARVMVCPAIEIVAAAEQPMHRELKERLRDYQVVIFVSANAVEFAFHHLDAAAFTEALQIGAIGEGTARVLASHLPDRQSQVIRGTTSNSEGLLNAAALQTVDGMRVLIFRGQSGRNLLGDELTRRGATVEYCEVYHRRAPARLCPEIQQSEQQPTLYLFTSNEGMVNFNQLLPERIKDAALQTPWLLISERMRESAQQLGHNGQIIIAADASETGILRSVCEWVSLTRTKSKASRRR